MREGAGALRCARNASLLHKLNPALQMSAAKVLKCVFTCEERRGERKKDEPLAMESGSPNLGATMHEEKDERRLLL